MLKYLLSAIIFIVLYGIYLKIMNSYLKNQIKIVQGNAMSLKIIPFLIINCIIICGLNTFIIQKHRSVNEAALLGFIYFSIFEWMNYSLFSEWYILTVFINTLFGTLLFGTTTYCVYQLEKLFHF